jgi:hypothetical protein
MLVWPRMCPDTTETAPNSPIARALQRITLAKVLLVVAIELARRIIRDIIDDLGPSASERWEQEDNGGHENDWISYRWLTAITGPVS